MSQIVKNQVRKWGVVSFVVLSLATLLLTGYTHYEANIFNQPDSTNLNPFVETGFPYISTSVDARKLGTAFPADNQAARTLALQLGDSAYACFDTDLLRWSVAWTGKFLPMVLMAQISYKNFFNKNNGIAKLTGEAKIATGPYAGWTVGKPIFRDGKTTLDQTWKALPAEQARWSGVYVYGNQAILSYSVGDSKIFELPGIAKFEGQVAFTRTIRAEHIASDLYMTVAEISNGTSSEVKGKIAYVYQGANKDSVTAIGIAGKGAWQPEVTDGKYLTVKVPASSKQSEAMVLIWKGPTKSIKAFEKLCRIKPAALPDFAKGGPTHWKETITTKGVTAPDTAAFVTDQLTLPLANPWKRNVRVADIAFFKDGRAAVVTFEGDVWTVDGITKDLANVKWKRFASGLHEPMSIEVVRDTIYVFDRGGIVKLHDLNQDGNADYYENFSNIMPQSAESREWAADLVYAPDGSFYVAKGGSLSNGPGMTSMAVGKGFRTGSDQNGTILKISPDGRRFEVIATGLRGPYLGLHPENGTLTATDQQGNFVPSTPIYVIKKGDYYGVPPTAHRSDNPPIAPPLTWIPHSVDRSSLGQAWITGNKMGPLNGSLIHFSFGTPGLFRVLIDSTSKIMQGGVSYINASYPAPTSKGAINPADEQLYVTGFNLWGSASVGISSLMRLRYTGKPSYMPNQFRAGTQGVILGFDSELDRAAATNLASFDVKRYNYNRTEEYGSGHFKLDKSTGEEIMPVAGAYVSADGKKVLLLIPDMTEVMQMEVAYRLLAKDGKKMNDHFYFTVNSSDDINLKKYGFDNVDLALLTAKKTEMAAQPARVEVASIERGQEVFQKMACAGCHSPGTKTDGMYGPPFKNLYKSQRIFDDGTKVLADESYLRESILSPSKKIVKGYNEEMPSFVGVLSDSEIESVILYIKSLSGN
ncbi:DUF6797 domain-containing protein [Dyadobacter arcticus]|uniref:Glucose/arabinose dehydrogenase/cytochrome c2 n=1 Tax=Dyadobacter arcticus TaxID=1078754 RepID=A0ABX0UP64_9BACT|nr:DUF6797 domain-containing protein [Dyadobacter arcticus]NIJ54782.1 glucose/arabinose dehydrogenase/cytochrome c2 [Dyadobacter arcticus]